MHAEIYKGGKRAAVVPPPKRKPRGHDLMEGCPLWVDHMGCWGSKACLPVGDPASWPLWPSEHRGTIGTPGRTFCDLVVRRQTTFKYCGFCGWVHHSCSASPHSGFKSYSHPCPIATVKLTPRRWSQGRWLRLWPQSPHCCVPSGPLLPAKVMLGISLAEAGLPLCAWEKRPDFWQDSVVYLKSHQMSLWPKQLPSLQPEPKFCWFFFFFFWMPLETQINITIMKMWAMGQNVRLEFSPDTGASILCFSLYLQPRVLEPSQICI